MIDHLRLAWRLRPSRAQLRYAYLDLRGWLGGWCHACPWNVERGGSGGYVHWRCRRPRGHDGLHRFNSYIWAPNGMVSYEPLPVLGYDHPPAEPESPFTRGILGATWWQALSQWRDRNRRVAQLEKLAAARRAERGYR